MTRLPEVISTVRRRRTWRIEEKVAILDAAFSKGGSVAAAADAFGISRSLIYIWRQQVRNGLMPGVAMSAAGVSAFAPVTIRPEPEAHPPEPATPPERQGRERRSSGVLHVRLTNGRTLTVDDGIAPDVLARIAAALEDDARLRQDRTKP